MTFKNAKRGCERSICGRWSSETGFPLSLSLSDLSTERALRDAEALCDVVLRFLCFSFVSLKAKPVSEFNAAQKQIGECQHSTPRTHVKCSQ